MPSIELINITKMFDEGKVLAVDNISLKIEDGDYIFLIGPSGCGKTTTLRMIAGLEKPTKGTILINSKDVEGIPPEDRDMGFIFQHFEIFDHMTVWENVTFGLEMRGYKEDYICTKAEAALKTVGLLGYADNYPSRFGNPGLQKLGIARAIATGAKILIMDEPLGSLDPKVSKVFRHQLRNLIKDLGLTAIHVTHNQEEAMAIADKIVVMRAGRILQMGTPYDLYENPNSIFVANFLGETNFLQGFVLKLLENGEMKVWIRLGGPKIFCHKDHKKFDLDDGVVVAFRYEDVYLFPTDYDFEGSRYDWSKMQFFTVILESSRFIGATKRFYLTLDSGDKILSTKPGNFAENFVPGEQLIVGIHQDDIHVFEAPDDLMHELSLM
ncbi:MAG: ATP-binding cassette domain-containing protein [Candidatus Lokiarchaeota archaeon]|nr:ATP-binding cassette domain-containing protein [Candidatus Lokiarchaeota archaeon]MBD3341498.1 ATP-binding cassette domain-containing protein [Candidatus Lokiarchaeota archaeon]